MQRARIGWRGEDVEIRCGAGTARRCAPPGEGAEGARLEAPPAMACDLASEPAAAGAAPRGVAEHVASPTDSRRSGNGKRKARTAARAKAKSRGVECSGSPAGVPGRSADGGGSQSAPSRERDGRSTRLRPRLLAASDVDPAMTAIGRALVFTARPSPVRPRVRRHAPPRCAPSARHIARAAARAPLRRVRKVAASQRVDRTPALVVPRHRDRRWRCRAELLQPSMGSWVMRDIAAAPSRGSAHRRVRR